MIKDSGERTVFENGFQRDMHEGKGRMDLLPLRAIIEVSKHCEEGAKKYGERNIDKGAPQHSLIDSAFRHLAKYALGETDENHLRACAWNILWALQQDVTRPDMIDIPAVRMAHNLREMNNGKDIPKSDSTNNIKEKISKCLNDLEVIKENFETPSKSFHNDIGEHLTQFKFDPRCVEHTCFYNTDGLCNSVSDLWDSTLGEECPDYSED